MNRLKARHEGEHGSTGRNRRAPRSTRRMGREPGTRGLRRFPRPALRAWPEISRRVRGARFCALFLDFDGTLAPLRRRPQDARCSPQVKGILRRLVSRPNLWAGVVSGRRKAFLRRRIGVPGVHYFGAFGAEGEGGAAALGPETRRALARTNQDLKVLLKAAPGVWAEDKGLSVTVHYRGASRRAIRTARRLVHRILGSGRRALRLLEGTQTWEFTPRAVQGKGTAVRAVMNRLTRGSLGIYIGDDAADESAFAALSQGITVRVGKIRNTRAQFFLRSPGEVARFLRRLQEDLR